MSTFVAAIQRGTRGAQPAANSVITGTLYFVTDESVIERSNGSAWQSYSATVGSGTVTHTGTLTANALMLGNGGVDITALGSLGTTSTVLHGNAAGAPTFGAVALATDVSGDLPFANLTQIAGLSVLGVTGSATADVAAITATVDGQVLTRVSGSSMTWQAPSVPSGSVVQVVNTQSGAEAHNSTTIPLDDSIPQNTEGSEYMTLAITPNSATNKLKIDVVFFGSVATAAELAVALFQDTTADALAVTSTTDGINTARLVVPLTHYMTAGTTSSTTFKVRAGSSSGAQVTFNGVSAGRLYGGAAASSITITEIKV